MDQRLNRLNGDPRSLKGQIMISTATELNRVLQDFTTDWPNHPDPFAGLPVKKRADRQLYLAAGTHHDDPPLPPGLSPAEVRRRAEEGLLSAELELRMALLARMDFHQGLMSLDRMLFQSGFPLPLIVELCQRDAPASAPAGRVWIAEHNEPVLFWVNEHQRILRRKRGLATASLCRLRQLSCGYGLLAAAILEPLLSDPEGRFTAFYDQVIAAIPECDFHYTGRHSARPAQPGCPPVAQVINNTPMNHLAAEHGPTSGATLHVPPRPRWRPRFARVDYRAVLRSVSAAPIWPNASWDPAYDDALRLLGSAQLELGACLAVRAVVTADCHLVDFVQFLLHLPRHELLDHWQSVCLARPTTSADLRAWIVARVAEARLLQAEYENLLDRHEGQSGSVSAEEFAELTDRLGDLSRRLLKPRLRSAPGVDALFDQVAVPGCRFHYTK
jgi:hypothetical protein